MQTNSMPPPVGALAFLQRQQEFALIPWGQHGLVLSADIICADTCEICHMSQFTCIGDEVRKTRQSVYCILIEWDIDFDMN